jgi:hypothetical protein
MSPEQVEYSVSAPAIHAARTLSMHYHLIEKAGGDVPFSDHNVAVLIDVHTQAWRIKAAMKNLFKHMYYPDVRSLEANMEAVRAGIEALDAQRRNMPTFDDESADRLHDRLGIEDKQSRSGANQQAMEYRVSAPALHACRMIHQHFDFVEKESGTIEYSERNVAGIIDICTQIWRLEIAMNELCTRTPWETRGEYLQHVAVIRRALQAVDLAQMRLPSYGREMKQPLWRTETREAKITDQQRRRSEQYAAALRNARNPEEMHRALGGRL